MRALTFVLGSLLLSVGAAGALNLPVNPVAACSMVLGPGEGAECATEYDGGQHGDASNVCAAPSPVLVHNSVTTGLVVPVLDEWDNYAYVVTAAQVGHAVTVLLAQSPLLGSGIPADLGTGYALRAFTPGCSMMLAESFTAFPSGTARVRFTPAFAGIYTVMVVGYPPSLGPLAAPDPLGYQTDFCHSTCFGAGINPAAGYALAVNG